VQTPTPDCSIWPQTILSPPLVPSLPQIPEDKTPEDLYRALNVVKRQSVIRVEADEPSYPLHVILRYELETALLSGKLSTDDLAAAWNARMQADLGVLPADDAQGVLIEGLGRAFEQWSHRIIPDLLVHTGCDDGRAAL
jgi:hypothetical protein